MYLYLSTFQDSQSPDAHIHPKPMSVTVWFFFQPWSQAYPIFWFFGLHEKQGRTGSIYHMMWTQGGSSFFDSMFLCWPKGDLNNQCAAPLTSTWCPSALASSLGHSQILSRSRGEKSGEDMCFLCFFILSACTHVLIQDPGKRETHSWHAWNGSGHFCVQAY